MGELGKRVECPSCGTWKCDTCNWRKYYTRFDELVRCPKCRTTDGTIVPVIHTNVYIAEEHMYENTVKNPEPMKDKTLTAKEFKSLVHFWFGDDDITQHAKMLEHLGFTIEEEPDEVIETDYTAKGAEMRLTNSYVIYRADQGEDPMEARERADGFIAKIKADALREFADAYQDEADHNTPADIDPDLLRERAGRIEGAK